MCKISKVFSINFILIRCGSVPYNYKTENVFAVWHMIRHTTKDFAVCHSAGHTAKLAEAADGDARRQAAASTPRAQAAASTLHTSPSRWPRRPRSPVPPLPTQQQLASLPCTGSRGTRQRGRLCRGLDWGTRQSWPKPPPATLAARPPRPRLAKPLATCAARARRSHRCPAPTSLPWAGSRGTQKRGYGKAPAPYPL